MLGDGASAGEHTESGQRQFAKFGMAAKAPPRQDGPPLPVAGGYIWRWFNQIGLGLPSGYGPSLVTWESVAVWSRLMKQDLEPWEVLALVRLGALRARILSEKSDGGNGAQG